MSQGYGPPAGTDTIGAGLVKIQDSFAALLTLHSGTTAPSTTYAGMLWHDTTANALKLRNQANSAWITVLANTTAAGGGLLPLTGGTMSGAIAMGTSKITGLGAATAGTDALRKSQVDGILWPTPIRIGTVSATGNLLLTVGGAGTIVADVYLLVDTSIATHGSNYWTFQVRNLGPAGAGTTDLLSAAKSTAATAITASVPYGLGVNQNQTLAFGDVIQLRITKNGSAANLDSLLVVVAYQQPTAAS